MGVYKSGVASESHDQSLEVLQNARSPSSKIKHSRKRAPSQTDGRETALQLLPDPEGCLVCVRPKTLHLGQGRLLPAAIYAHKGFKFKFAKVFSWQKEWTHAGIVAGACLPQWADTEFWRVTGSYLRRCLLYISQVRERHTRMKSAVKLWSEFYCVKTPELKKKK